MRKLGILTPVYNDWESLLILLSRLNEIASDNDLLLYVTVVDDCSSQPYPVWDTKLFDRLARLEVVSLVRNLGHQRAIAIGLAVLNAAQVQMPIIVLDSDGEDQPEDILRLLAEHEHNPGRIIFARREKRSEGSLFRFFYGFFKILFRLLTGQQISFGNFCLIPAEFLARVAHLQELWNHFPVGIVHSGLPWSTVPTNRGKRYAGNSHMNLTALVLHGLSAISVYIEVVYMRLLFFAFGLILLDVIAFLILLYIRFGTSLAIPGWATSVAVGLTVVMVQAILFLALLSFVVLSYRTVKVFIPAVDYQDYLLRLDQKT